MTPASTEASKDTGYVIVLTTLKIMQCLDDSHTLPASSTVNETSFSHIDMRPWVVRRGSVCPAWNREVKHALTHSKNALITTLHTEALAPHTQNQN